MSDNKIDMKERLRISIETRSLEIQLFWNRSLFFWGFNLAAGAGYATALEKAPPIATVVACLGMVCAFAWTLVNRGSKYWQDNWEKKVESLEHEQIGSFFKVQEAYDSPRWLGARRFSVSDLATALSDYVFFLWVIAVANQLILISVGYKLAARPLALGNVVIPVFSVGYLVYMYVKSRRPMPRPKIPNTSNCSCSYASEDIGSTKARAP